MAADRRRDAIRRKVADLLRRVGEVVDPDGAAVAAEPQPGGGASDAAPDDAAALEPEDVTLDAAYFLDRIGVGWEVCVIDVREADERARDGVIPDAVHLTLAELSARPDRAPSDETTLVISTTGRRALTAALALRAAGHPDAWSVTGGFAAWRRAGGPVEVG
ncbi:MAG: hypothetical protein H6733_12395 [Alphaproteobacteria bacterium]|nr:hypothetical protein [Alphaproteobacteria bacterium]